MSLKQRVRVLSIDESKFYQPSDRIGGAVISVGLYASFGPRLGASLQSVSSDAAVSWQGDRSLEQLGRPLSVCARFSFWSISQSLTFLI